MDTSLVSRVGIRAVVDTIITVVDIITIAVDTKAVVDTTIIAVDTKAVVDTTIIAVVITTVADTTRVVTVSIVLIMIQMQSIHSRSVLNTRRRTTIQMSQSA